MSTARPDFDDMNHDMDPDVRRLEALDFWRRPIAVAPLPGGITNRNYLVDDAGCRYVARLCTDRTLLGIDRRNEAACQLAAHNCGVAPAVVYHGEGVLISEHLPGRTLAPADVRDPGFIPRLAAVLRKLHDEGGRAPGEFLDFSAIEAVRSYAGTARRLGALLPADIDGLVEDAGRISRRVEPCRPALCHNDLLASNILADDGRVWLVDWEYAGVGHPLFDLAGVAANCAFPEPLEVALLAAYRGRADGRELAEMRILRALSLLREALWSAIQSVASDLDFDYPRYTAENFAAYREARARLDLSTGADLPG